MREDHATPPIGRLNFAQPKSRLSLDFRYANNVRCNLKKVSNLKGGLL